MNKPLGIGDFIASFKGDTPGHPFRGNQWSSSGGVGITVDKSGNSVTLHHTDKGHIKLTDEGNNTLAIDDVYVFNPADRGKGIGKEMYSGLFDYAKQNNKKIVSGKTVENPAAKIWQRMKDSGYPVKIDPDAHEAEGGGYWHANNKPVFSVDFRGS